MCCGLGNDVIIRPSDVRDTSVIVIQSMEAIIKNAEELRTLISESSFGSQDSDISLNFISAHGDLEKDVKDADDEENLSYCEDVDYLQSLKPKSWRNMKYLKLTEVSFMSPFKVSANLNSDNLTSLEWESPGHGWHDIRTFRTTSDYGSNNSDSPYSDEESLTFDDSDQDFWEWDSVCSYKVDNDKSKGLNESKQLEEDKPIMSRHLYNNMSDTISPIATHVRCRRARQRLTSCVRSDVLTSSINLTPGRD